MRPTIVLMLLLAPFVLAEEADRGFHLRLQDNLDRPEDGYCLDVTGSGQYVRFDMPLTTHNCKGPHFYADEEVVHRKDGTLFFPAYEGCVTVMGNNQHALPKNALMLKACGAEEPFLNGPRFQHFAFNDKSQLILQGSDLCITAGDVSRTTFSDEHKWRALYMEVCSKAPLSLSQWHLVKPKGY